MRLHVCFSLTSLVTCLGLCRVTRRRSCMVMFRVLLECWYLRLVVLFQLLGLSRMNLFCNVLILRIRLLVRCWE